MISFQPPSREIVKARDQIEDPIVLFKVAYKFGHYYLFHKDSLTNETFQDSSEMIWHILKFYDIP